MQVIPKDPGWDTLAQSLMTLYNAEIKNKALNLQEIQHQIELQRQLGNLPAVEGLTQTKIPIANQLFQQRPGNPLTEQLANLNPSNIEGNIDLSETAQSIYKNPEVAKQMKYHPQVMLDQVKADQQQYDVTPAVNQQYLTEKDAGSLVMRTINNLKEQTKGKPADEVSRLYDQSVAQLMNIGTIFRRRDIVASLGPLKDYLPTGVGGKEVTHRAIYTDALGGGNFDFTTSIQPGKPGWAKAVLEGAKEAGKPNLSINQISGYTKPSGGMPSVPDAIKIGQTQTAVENDVNKQLDKINSDTSLSEKEKAAQAKQIAKENGVIVQGYRNTFGKKLNFEFVRHDPSNPEKLIQAQDNLFQMAEKKGAKFGQYLGEEFFTPKSKDYEKARKELLGK